MSDSTLKVNAHEEVSGTKSGIELIAEERKKQLAKYTPEHDDGHANGELANAARTLIFAASCPGLVPNKEAFGLVGKHLGDQIAQLRIAGALCAAEIDRLQRLAVKGGSK